MRFRGCFIWALKDEERHTRQTVQGINIWTDESISPGFAAAAAARNDWFVGTPARCARIGDEGQVAREGPYAYMVIR